MFERRVSNEVFIIFVLFFLVILIYHIFLRKYNVS